MKECCKDVPTTNADLVREAATAVPHVLAGLMVVPVLGIKRDYPDFLPTKNDLGWQSCILALVDEIVSIEIIVIVFVFNRIQSSVSIIAFLVVPVLLFAGGP